MKLSNEERKFKCIFYQVNGIRLTVSFTLKEIQEKMPNWLSNYVSVHIMEDLD